MTKNLLTPNLLLTHPDIGDVHSMISFERRNQNHLVKWESTIFNQTECNSSLDEIIHKRLRSWIKECDEGRSLRFCMKPKENPELIIGFCNFTQIIYGSFQACYLGYKIDQAYEGRGLMFEALNACISYIFKEVGLHRIMANYMPINKRSAKLLERLGFSIEGYAKKYLFINNRWEDHVLTALSFEEWEDYSLT